MIFLRVASTLTEVLHVNACKDLKTKAESAPSITAEIRQIMKPAQTMETLLLQTMNYALALVST